jgi:hypothetical protein
VKTLRSTPDFVAAKSDIEGLRGTVDKEPPEKAADAIQTVMEKIGAIAGADKVRSELYKARRALTSRTPNKGDALKALDSALTTYQTEVTWRQKAVQSVLPGLSSYEAAIRDTIGLRKQEKLPAAVVPSIAGCTAYHRDISLQF